MSSTNRISELIAAIGDGDFDDKATKELNKLVEAVEAGHGSGKVTITIGFKKENRMLVAKPTVKATIPVAAVDSSMFFVDDKGRLTDEDPKQLPLRGVPRRPTNVVDMTPRKPEAPDAPAGTTTDTNKKD